MALKVVFSAVEEPVRYAYAITRKNAAKESGEPDGTGPYYFTKEALTEAYRARIRDIVTKTGGSPDDLVITRRPVRMISASMNFMDLVRQLAGKTPPLAGIFTAKAAREGIVPAGITTSTHLENRDIPRSMRGSLDAAGIAFHTVHKNMETVDGALCNLEDSVNGLPNFVGSYLRDQYYISALYVTPEAETVTALPAADAENWPHVVAATLKTAHRIP